MDLNGKADPFCALNVNGKGEPQKTQVVMKDKNPVWNQDFNIPVENPEKDKLYITVYDFDEGNDNDVIGFNRLPINDIKVGDAPVERTVELKKRHGIRPDRGVVHLKLSAFNPGEEPGAAPAAEHPVKSEVPPKAEFLDCTVVSASNLVKMDKHGLSDPYVVLKVNKDGEPQKTDVVKQNLNPEWNQEFHFTPVDKTKDVLVVECYDWDDHNSHDLIGNAILELAQYAYDIPIEADVELKKEGGHRKDRGTVHLRFTIRKDKTGEPDDEHTTSEEENNKAVAKADPIVLHCTVVDGVELPAMDITGFSDPFVRLTVNGQGKPYTTGIVMRELNPIWNQEFNIPIDNQNKDKLYITCYDWDEDSANDLIGYYRLPLDDIKVGEPVERECILKKKHALRANRGKIHLKICAFKPGEEPQVSKVPGAHPIKNIKPKETLLDATVVNARDLVPMDKNGKSDPYVILKLNRNGIPQQTTVVKASLNPDINENFDFTLIDPKTDVLLVYCYDWDDHNNHDLIGVGEIPLEGIALDVPVEKQVELKKEGGHRKERGKVNLKLRLHNSRDGESDASDEEANLDNPEKPADPIVLRCTVIDAKGLPAMDMNGKADPFCVLSVNGEGEQYKTNVVMRSLTPVWNQPFNIPVPNQDKDKLHVIVYDWDEKNSDDVIGYNKIKLHEIRINHPVETLVHLKKRHGVRTERGDVHLRFEAYKPGTEPAIDFVPTAHPEKKVSQEAPTVVDCTVVNATELAMMDLNGKADPYVIVKINENGKINTTKVVKKDRNPVWNETFNMDVADEKKDVLIVECYDWDAVSYTHLTLPTTPYV